jgi:hypothetical protein
MSAIYPLLNLSVDFNQESNSPIFNPDFNLFQSKAIPLPLDSLSEPKKRSEEWYFLNFKKGGEGETPPLKKLENYLLS